MDNLFQLYQNPPFKFKDLKVYASTEWLEDNKKKYRQVFDRFDVTYIYAELSLINRCLGDNPCTIHGQLKCFDVKNTKKPICNLNFTKEISDEEPIIYIREGWGNTAKGVFWKKGSYYWEAWIDGAKIATAYFYIDDAGQFNNIQDQVSAYLTLKSLKFYEGPFENVNENKRIYLSQFSEGSTRYIFTEARFQSNLKDSWHCELIFRFYNESKELKGQISRLTTIHKDAEEMVVTAGWGSNSKDNWKKSKYSVEVIFMNSVIGTGLFAVDEVEIQESSLPASVFIDDQLSFEHVYQKLDTLIGLEEVKSRVKEHALYLEFLKLRREKGFQEVESSNLHAVFIGNPGTGKTTVAKMMGLLYRKMGLLSKGHVVEVDRGDLIGEYIGQTAPKVKDVIEKARGGVLFIDEAYALARSNDDAKDFGKEAIEILVREMSNGKGDLAIIVAGYPKEMKYFIASNPGLKSRFKHFFEFQDYLPQELIEIALYIADKLEIKFNPDSFEIIKDIIRTEYRKRDKSFGNARYVHDLLERAKLNLGLRVMKRKNPSKLTKEEMSVIYKADVLALQNSFKNQTPDLPIDEHSLAAALAELQKLTGMENVKNQIYDLVRIVQYHRENGRSVLSNYSLHTVFVGNPGTGKTTVARILTKIYKALGLLERGHIVETDRQGLVAGYLGQTAIKTNEKIDEAEGGVLFIDEAYALGSVNNAQGDYGSEAIQTLLKRMEDNRGRFYVFVAGYPDNMESFLKANPGLNSRFDKVFKFEDYSASELKDIAVNMFESDGYKLTLKAGEAIQIILEDLHNKRDKYFGNARTVRKLVLDIIKQQNVRVSTILVENRSTSQIKSITFEDVTSANDIIKGELIQKKMIGFRSSDH
ncbi:MAG: AAA family ATPase [Saprospiraceae bacterium]|nr:AAA family ATPase [Saprospiraceae bacterium]MCB9310955.1 AAA family ATPase [Lewinellaceae bacterium]